AVFHGIIHHGPKPLVAGTTLEKPIIALGANVSLPRGSRSIVIAIGGHIEARGQVSDDLVALGGNIYLDRGAHVSSDVLSMLGGIYQAPGATATGRLGGALHPWNGERLPSQPNFDAMLAGNVRLGLAAGLALLLIGMCLTIVFPWQIVLISTTLRSAPLKSSAAGLFCLVTFTFLVIPLGLSLAGLPFAMLLAGAGTLAWLFGLTAAAVVLGRLLAHGAVSLLWATTAGLLLLALSLAVPIVGAFLVTAVGLAGAGALAVALLSRSRPSVLPA
ncbi:MAG: hypothetical protein M3Z66_10710, partial [Chloroflexota bacterium]|nr:hypothetical protein [Chloroflexota bacterium]